MSQKNLGFLYICYIAKKREFPPVYKVERVAKMSVKRVFFGVFQKIMVICCAIFFGIANAFAANLPSGYTELEYIGTTGTQYIDTQAALTVNFDLHATIEVVSTLKGFFIGSTNGSDDFFVGVYSSETLNSGISGAVAWGGIPYPGKDIKFSFAISPTRFIGYNGVVRDLSRPYRGNGKLLIGNTETNAKAYFYSIKLYDGDNLSFNGVPAKRNSDGVLGMYDTVSGNFFENQGTGTFIAGPAKCRNLFDGIYPNPTGAPKYKAIYVGEGTFTCSYSMPHDDSNTSMVYFLPGNVSAGANNRVNQVDATHPRTVAAVDGYVTIAYRNGTSIGMGNAVPSDYHAQIERGTTATDYVPFCSAEIKIATTAYNAARFSPVQTDLNNAVATIREIVTNTINQTAAIADLQATKQTRPDEQCPAGKKCLLVETEENGVIVPHWFPIIEAPTD